VKDLVEEYHGQCILCKQAIPEAKEHMVIISGQEVDIGYNKEGNLVTIKEPEYLHKLPVCDACVKTKKRYINKMRLLHIPLGLILLAGTGVVGYFTLAFFFDGSFFDSIGIRIGDMQVVPVLAIVIVIIPFAIMWYTAKFCLRRGFSGAKTLMRRDLADEARAALWEKLSASLDEQARKKLFTIDNYRWDAIAEENKTNRASVVRTIPNAVEADKETAEARAAEALAAAKRQAEIDAVARRTTERQALLREGLSSPPCLLEGANDYAWICSVCGSEQRKNRRVCFKCGVVFESMKQEG